MDHTPAKDGDGDDGGNGGESDNGNVDVDDDCDNNDENLYDKVPHVALKMKADEQG